MNKKTTMPEDRSLLERAKELRKNMTQEERKLWYLYLSKHPLRFYRQKIIGHYICDFYCPVIRLVIELDGSQHYTEKEEEYDKKKTAFLESCHIKVIRFYNGQVNLHFKEVCMEIEKAMPLAIPPRHCVALSRPGGKRVTGFSVVYRLCESSFLAT